MRTQILVATTLAASLMLTACGGDDATPTANTLSGVAAVGAPIVGGRVDVSCAGGSALSTTTDSAGAWLVTISGQTLPCALKVSNGTINGAANSTPYHSIALDFNTINLTPLTDLVVANLVGKDPAVWFTGLNAAAFNTVNSTALTAALQKVNTALGLTTTLNGTNPLTTSFSPVKGNKLDNILEALAKARVSAGLNYAQLLNLAWNSTFNIPTSFNFSSAYAAVQVANGTASGTTGGSSSVTCASGETALIYSGGGLYTDGRKMCFTGSPTALSFSGKTLNNPTLNSAVSAPFAAYTFSDASAVYEVILNSGSLYEINVLDSAKKYIGQFALPTSAGTGTGAGATSGTANLEVQVLISGVAAPTVTIGSVPLPSSESDFCGAMNNDATLSQITANGGSLKINSCSFSGNTGKVDATLTMTIPFAMTVPYTIMYNYK